MKMLCLTLPPIGDRKEGRSIYVNPAAIAMVTDRVRKDVQNRVVFGPGSTITLVGSEDEFDITEGPREVWAMLSS